MYIASSFLNDAKHDLNLPKDKKKYINEKTFYLSIESNGKMFYVLKLPNKNSEI